ncbi:hypothetical protein [Actinoplanes sp. NPDC026619]|uniref:hypothetical protein n=1 Tax=Actinoplanes sp. NPDC026619 TaxID=3155798 RepID=UPI0033E7EE54
MIDPHRPRSTAPATIRASRSAGGQQQRRQQHAANNNAANNNAASNDAASNNAAAGSNPEAARLVTPDARALGANP